jgi:hypothetical protein
MKVLFKTYFGIEDVKATSTTLHTFTICLVSVNLKLQQELFLPLRVLR